MLSSSDKQKNTQKKGVTRDPDRLTPPRVQCSPCTASYPGHRRYYRCCFCDLRLRCQRRNYLAVLRSLFVASQVVTSLLLLQSFLTFVTVISTRLYRYLYVYTVIFTRLYRYLYVYTVIFTRLYRYLYSFIPLSVCLCRYLN